MREDSMAIKRYRDKIHGDIHWDEFVTKIINCPEFQRLDGILQLGFANFVYRGAKHSRFEHSVGSYYLAQRILEHAKENHKIFGLPFPYGTISPDFGTTNEEKFEAIKKVVGYAALLHDLSHVPFGHTLEDEFNEFYVKHDGLESTRLYHLFFNERSNVAKIFDEEKPFVANLNNHDLRKLLFLAIKFRCVIDEKGYTSFKKLIADALERIENNKTLLDKREHENAKIMLNQLDEDYDRFTSNNLFHPFMNDLVADTICADLLDYVMRDADGTGLEAMGYDSRIFDYFILAKDLVTGQLRLALKVYHNGKERLDLVTEVLRTMNNRYYLAERVYYHRSKAAASTILNKVLKIVGAPPDINPYKESAEPAIISMTDSDLMFFLKDKINGFNGKEKVKEELKELVKILEGRERRKLYKACVQIPHEFASRKNLFVKILDRYRAPGSSTNRDNLEKTLNEVVEKGEYRALIYCPSSKMQAKEVDTLIFSEKDRVVPLKLHYKHLIISEELEQLNKKYVGLWKFFLFMHPEDLKNDIIVTQIVTRFCKEIGMSPNEAKEVTPYCYYTEEELRARYLRKWKKEKRPWVPAEAFDDIEEVIQNQSEQNNLFSREQIFKTPECFYEKFDKIFLYTQFSKYVEKKEKEYPKKRKKQLLQFKNQFPSKIEKDPSELMIRIDSSVSRDAPDPTIPGSDIFDSELETFQKNKKSLDKYSKARQKV